MHNANIHGGLWFPLTKCHCIIIFKIFAHYFAQSWQGAVIIINPAIKSNYESGRKWWWLMGRGGKWDRSRAANGTSRNFPLCLYTVSRQEIGTSMINLQTSVHSLLAYCILNQVWTPFNHSVLIDSKCSKFSRSSVDSSRTQHPAPATCPGHRATVNQFRKNFDRN